MRLSSRFARPSSAVAALLSVGIGCSAGDAPAGSDTFQPQPDPEIGTTTFISAASSGSSRYEGPVGGAPTDSEGSGQPRTVEEGDIYRLLGDGKILNLNAYRGLQVIDSSDPDHPIVEGKLRISASPVELYVDGSRAIVLVNDWYGYSGSKYDPSWQKEQGGAILLVDLVDPAAPRLVDRLVVPGYLRTSRLAKGTETVLYATASLWQMYDGAAGEVVAVGSAGRTIVQSIVVGKDGLSLNSELDLGGAISDIQATPTALLVARYVGPSTSRPTSARSSCSGTMASGTARRRTTSGGRRARLPAWLR